MRASNLLTADEAARFLQIGRRTWLAMEQRRWFIEAAFKRIAKAKKTEA